MSSFNTSFPYALLVASTALLTVACAPQNGTSPAVEMADAGNTYNFDTGSKYGKNSFEAQPQSQLAAKVDKPILVEPAMISPSVSDSKIVVSSPAAPKPVPALGKLDLKSVSLTPENSSSFAMTEPSRSARTVTAPKAVRYPNGYLASSAIVGLLADHTAFGQQNDTNGNWAEFTAKNGRAIFRNKNGKVSDGTWWVESNKVCFSYKQQSSATHCNYVRSIDGQYQYVHVDGSEEFLITKLTQGDVEDLTTSVLIRN